MIETKNTKSKIVARNDWLVAREALLVKEKELTHACDQIAAERRRLPREKVTKHYLFDTPSGKRGLGELFDTRRQLIIYHHMLKPADLNPCTGCGVVGDQIPHLAHLHARNTVLVFVSRAPIDEILQYKKRMGWAMPWVAKNDDFNADFGVTTFGFNVFLQENGSIYLTYSTSGRGVEMLGTIWALLDITPYGRQENWQALVQGTPQTKPHQ